MGKLNLNRLMIMKNGMKLITVMLMILAFTSCDPLFHDDFIIINNCNEDINVSVTYQAGDKQNFIVSSLSEYTFHDNEWSGGVSQVEKIDYIFQTIDITKDSIASKINYVNYRLWRKENVESSRQFTYYTKVKYYLTINPKDFE